MIDWAELANITTQVDRLKGRWQAAKTTGDAALMETLANQLKRATFVRDTLLSQIAQRIGGGRKPPHIHAKSGWW